MSNLCAYCNQRPVHPGFQYCGKICGNKAKTGQTPVPLSNPCDVCHQRPKHCDSTTGQLYSFCGKSCALRKVVVTVPMTTTQAFRIPPGICQIPGCDRQAFSGSSFCGVGHRDLGKTICLWCRQKPQYQDSAFCGKGCMNAAEAKGPMLLPIPKGHNTFQSVVEQFQGSWRHNTKKPSVHHVYKIVLSPTSRQVYEAYRTSVELQRGLSMGNQRRRWHGSQRDCHIGDQGKTDLCNSSKCGICGIIRTSYQVSKAQRNISFGRFGAGVYTTSTSSKADSYAKNFSSALTTKAMFLNYVVVGRGSKYMMDRVTLTGPPAGYDSVLGEVGLALNHDECIVYRDDAIRPAYLVTYDA
ncbi:hypothetical protein E4T56_gene2591 [Termitomyces sp. T112]|nr:hypothetical protein E4T56_gene2591 [Termitomyces sp. T112]